MAYIDVAEPLSSPVILSHRMTDQSPEIATLAAVISHTYREWGYSVPDAIDHLADRSIMARLETMR